MIVVQVHYKKYLEDVLLMAPNYQHKPQFTLLLKHKITGEKLG